MNVNEYGYMGLMSRDRSPWDFPVSRDWEDIDCSATACIYNRIKKCTVPSLAKIGEDGRCGGFKTEIETKPKEEKVDKKEDKDEKSKEDEVLI